jgi:hypothetical protein
MLDLPSSLYFENLRTIKAIGNPMHKMITVRPIIRLESGIGPAGFGTAERGITTKFMKR